MSLVVGSYSRIRQDMGFLQILPWWKWTCSDHEYLEFARNHAKRYGFTKLPKTMPYTRICNWDCKILPKLPKDRGVSNSANVVLENYKLWRHLIYKWCCFTQLMPSQLSPLSFKSCSLQHLPRACLCFPCSAGGIHWEMSQGVQACTAAAYKAYLLLCIAAGA